MNKYIYLFLDIGSFLIPFLYSFERKRLHFIKYWKPYFLSISLVGILFILWDIYFTSQGYWGFNSEYLLGINLFNLPLEEWLFFLLIPYASNFIHYALLYFFPKPRISSKVTYIIAFSLALISSTITIFNYNLTYTFWSFGIFGILMWLQVYFKFELLNRYFLSFLIILIPFILVNSILTGSFIEDPVVWYNNQENLSFRIGTIPIEDFFYCFSMLYIQALIFEKLIGKNLISQKFLKA